MTILSKYAVILTALSYLTSARQPKSNPYSPRSIANYRRFLTRDTILSNLTGAAIARPEDAAGSEYITQVTVGTQTFNVVIDTGSSDFWLLSSLQPDADLIGHNSYSPGSDAVKLDGYMYNITYGDGGFSFGDVYRDNVTVGNLTTTMVVGAARNVSDDFISNTNIDGIMGFAFPSLDSVIDSNDQSVLEPSFFESIKDQLAEPLFAVALARKGNGSIDLGVIDETKYTGNITYTTVDNSAGEWRFNATGYRIGPGGQKTEAIISGVADTNTALLLVPQEIVDSYFAQVKSARFSQEDTGYIYDCSATLPDFSIFINDEYEAITPGSYLHWALAVDNVSCFAGIQATTGDLGGAVFGDVFLRSQYVVYESAGDNDDMPQLGFAEAKAVSENSAFKVQGISIGGVAIIVMVTTVLQFFL